MENTGKNWGIFMIWKKMMACALLLFVFSSFDSDGVYRDFTKIPVGYSSEGGEQLVSYQLAADQAFKYDFVPVIHVYENTSDMMAALDEEEISAALVDSDRMIFDNKMTDKRIILWLNIDNKYDTLICVREHFLEDHLSTAMKLAKTCTKGNRENIKIVPYKQWLEDFREKGYEEETIMPYLAPDFVDEMGV